MGIEKVHFGISKISSKEIIEEFFGKSSAKEEEEMEYYVKNLSDVEESNLKRTSMKVKMPYKDLLNLYKHVYNSQQT